MKGADYVLKVLVYFSLAIGVVIMLLPLVWMFSASFKPLGEVMRTPPTWIPLQPTVNNYKEVFRQVPFAKYY